MSSVFGVFFKTQNSELPNSELAFLIGQGFRFGFQLLLGAKGVDDNGCFSIDGTLIFTDAATSALLFFDNGTLFIITHNGMVRALFVTDETDFLRIPGNTSRLIDMGNAHLNEAFLLKGESPDRLRRADPSAEIAEFLTIANPGNKPRGVETSQARLQEG